MYIYIYIYIWDDRLDVYVSALEMKDNLAIYGMSDYLFIYLSISIYPCIYLSMYLCIYLWEDRLSMFPSMTWHIIYPYIYLYLYDVLDCIGWALQWTPRLRCPRLGCPRLSCPRLSCPQADLPKAELLRSRPRLSCPRHQGRAALGLALQG